MEKISNIDELKVAIAALEIKRTNEMFQIKTQLNQVKENLRPVNLIKNGLGSLFTSPGLKNGLIDVTMGVAAGFVAKRVFPGSSKSLFQQVLAKATQSFVSSEVAKNGERLRDWALSLLSKKK